MFGEGFGIEDTDNFFGFEVGFGGFGGDYAICGIFAERNFGNLANLKRLRRSVGQGVVCVMKSFSGRNQIVIHKMILTCCKNASDDVVIFTKSQ